MFLIKVKTRFFNIEEKTSLVKYASNGVKYSVKKIYSVQCTFHIESFILCKVVKELGIPLYSSRAPEVCNKNFQ